MSTRHKEIAGDILDKDEIIKNDLALLKDRFMMKGYTEQQWKDAPLDYIQYLIAYVVGQTLGMKTSPPFHVDELWHIHLLETKSYRYLEKKIIESIKLINSDVSINHIDHSVVHNMDGGRDERLKATHKLYNLLGFEYSNYREVKTTINDHQSKRLRPSSSPAVTDERIRISLISLTPLCEDCTFKNKKSTRMSKVINTYAKRFGVESGSFYFFFNGERIDPYQTAQDLNLEDNDMIEVMDVQAGCSTISQGSQKLHSPSI